MPKSFESTFEIPSKPFSFVATVIGSRLLQTHKPSMIQSAITERMMPRVVMRCLVNTAICDTPCGKDEVR